MGVKKKSKKIDIKSLVRKIKELLEVEDYEVAEKFCAKGLSLEPSNTEVLELAAIVKFELGEPEPATQYLLKCVSLEPESGYEKYMYLGQMTTEKTSIQYYLKGIEIIKNQIQQTKVTENSEEGQNLKRKAADAYVSMTEIYLSDLCFEPDAEAKCEEYLKLAAEVDPNCPVVYQTLASVRMSQNNLEDAVLNLKKSVEMWQANPQLTPSYENRISLARLMIEAQLYDDCLTLLETLQREDDQYVDLWYLYGWIYYLVGSESQDKLEYFASAAECLEQALKVIKLGQYCDHDLASHCTQLLEEIYSLYPKDQLRKEIDDALPPSEESDMELN